MRCRARVVSSKSGVAEAIANNRAFDVNRLDFSKHLTQCPASIDMTRRGYGPNRNTYCTLHHRLYSLMDSERKTSTETMRDTRVLDALIETPALFSSDNPVQIDVVYTNTESLVRLVFIDFFWKGGGGGRGLFFRQFF